MNSSGLLQSIQGCLQQVELSHGLYLSLSLAGLVGGLTHCAPMCGAFALSQSQKLEKINGLSLVPHHLGRITTYTALAALLASIVNISFLFLPIRKLIIAPILLSAGLIFLINTIPTLGSYFPWLAKLQIAAPYSTISKALAKLPKQHSALSQFTMGALLGFMPCGLVVSALMAASTAPSALEAAMAMAAFGAGTAPPLIGVALTGHALQAKHPLLTQRITEAASIGSGLWLCALATSLLI